MFEIFASLTVLRANTDCRWLWSGTSHGCPLTHAQKWRSIHPQEIQKISLSGSLRIPEVFLGGLRLLWRSFHHFCGPMRQHHQLLMRSGGSYLRPDFFTQDPRCWIVLDVQITSINIDNILYPTSSDKCSIVRQDRTTWYNLRALRRTEKSTAFEMPRLLD